MGCVRQGVANAPCRVSTCKPDGRFYSRKRTSSPSSSAAEVCSELVQCLGHCEISSGDLIGAYARSWYPCKDASGQPLGMQLCTARIGALHWRLHRSSVGCLRRRSNSAKAINGKMAERCVVELIHSCQQQYRVLLSSFMPQKLLTGR